MTCHSCHKTRQRPVDSESNSAPSRVRSRESQLHQTKYTECDHTYHKGVGGGLKNTCEVELDCNVVAGKKKGDDCISILSLVYAAMFVLCQLVPHTIAQLIAA